MSRELRALRRLEQGGYRFALIDGRVSFTYHGAVPVPTEWATPLLDEIKSNREQLIDILRARQEWVEACDGWCTQIPCTPDTDLVYVTQLAELATRGQLPNYEDGENDAGPDGWQRLIKSYAAKCKQP